MAGVKVAAAAVRSTFESEERWAASTDFVSAGEWEMLMDWRMAAQMGLVKAVHLAPWSAE
jgi:hypothetical protein